MDTSTMCIHLSLFLKLNKTASNRNNFYCIFLLFFFMKLRYEHSATIEFFILNKYFTYLQKPFEIEPFFCYCYCIACTAVCCACSPLYENSILLLKLIQNNKYWKEMKEKENTTCTQFNVPFCTDLLKCDVNAFYLS